MNAPLSRQVALIRGINVGKAKRIAMNDLRSLVEALGYLDVRTVLNSGNVVFSMPEVVRGDAAIRIEKALMDKLIVQAPVTIVGAADIAQALDENPLGELASDPAKLLFTVMSDAADRKRLLELTRHEWEPEALAVGTRVAYVWCPNGILSSRLNGEVSRILGAQATSRNWATMQKILEACDLPVKA